MRSKDFPSFWLTPSVLWLLSSKAQGAKDSWKTSQPCYVGIHWIALAEHSPMSTNVPGSFCNFSVFLQHFVLAKLATSSLRVNPLTSRVRIWSENLNPFMPTVAKADWQFWWYRSNKNNIKKIFKGELFISTQIISLLIFCIANLCFISMSFPKNWQVQRILVK